MLDARSSGRLNRSGCPEWLERADRKKIDIKVNINPTVRHDAI